MVSTMKIEHLNVLKNTMFWNLDNAKKLNEVSEEIEALLKEHGLIEKEWTYRYAKTRRFLGRCYFHQKVIEISIYHIFSPGANYLDTIKHEIAHALVGPKIQAHGKEWKLMAASIGAFPRACAYKSSMIYHRYKANCPNCGQEFHRNKKPRKLRMYWCTKCGPKNGMLKFVKV
jgi:predicted SprT family Zn-dependent metalloprotease